MAKSTPVGSVPEKVTLRPTAIGVHVIERLNRPGTEKSALLRHLVELGFACEQAGFILDGTVLRHGGSVWEVQPQIPDAPPAQDVLSAETSPVSPPPAALPVLPPDTKLATSKDAGSKVTVEKSPEGASPQGGGMAGRLRGLSG